jgi:hypothetical protein
MATTRACYGVLVQAYRLTARAERRRLPGCNGLAGAHESLHNVTGMIDSDIQDRLGIKVQSDSSNIDKWLNKVCL